MYDQHCNLVGEAIWEKVKLNVFPSTFDEDNTSEQIWQLYQHFIES